MFYPFKQVWDSLSRGYRLERGKAPFRYPVRQAARTGLNLGWAEVRYQTRIARRYALCYLAACAALVGLVVLALPGHGNSAEGVVRHGITVGKVGNRVAVVRGCGAEDGCRINYLPTGNWHVVLKRGEQ